ncbi:hypothetical protein GCM10023195_14000 [Actinoallomurus liliacearum]|uniref:Uncharacterized protein n=1 Tax=Actinoallomurus liliacearum TaxID=1080073 RepID=A0ABP8TCB7_9ACTN
MASAARWGAAAAAAPAAGMTAAERVSALAPMRVRVRNGMAGAFLWRDDCVPGQVGLILDPETRLNKPCQDQKTKQ